MRVSLRQLRYYTTKRLLNHRTSDVTQGYVQFDLEQLRSGMQAVEDFVLQKVDEQPSNGAQVSDADDRLDRPRGIQPAIDYACVFAGSIQIDISAAVPETLGTNLSQSEK